MYTFTRMALALGADAYEFTYIVRVQGSYEWTYWKCLWKCLDRKGVLSSKNFLAPSARWKVAAIHGKAAILGHFIGCFSDWNGLNKKRETLKIWVRCHLPSCIAPLRCYLLYIKGYRITSCAIHFENVVHFYSCIFMYVSYQICQDWPIHGPRCSQEVGFQHGHRSDGRQQATCATWICR